MYGCKSSSISKTYGTGTVIDKLKGLFNKDLPGHFAQARFGDLFVAVEAIPIFLCQDVAEGIVCKAEK